MVNGDSKSLEEFWKSIGFCAAICFTGNKERKEHLLTELSRIGIRNPYIVWSFPTPYKDFIIRRIPHCKEMDEHPGYVGATFAHYSAVKIAYELGYDKAFICEDDCRFLTDINAIEKYLANVPSDFDFLLLDSFGIKGFKATENQLWNLCDRSYSTAAYIVTRTTMRVLIELYESPVSGKYKHPLLRNSDHWANKKLLGQSARIYYANPNICIQCKCPGKTNTGTNYIWEQYKNRGIDTDRYAGY